MRKYDTINTKIINQIIHVELNRPKSLNALSLELFNDLSDLFDNINNLLLKNNDFDIRCVLLSGSSNNFSSGLDLKNNLIIESISSLHDKDNVNSQDPARASLRAQKLVKELQDKINSIENCFVPVICLVDGFCLGGATSLATVCDIRLTTKQAKWSIKEIDIGLTADIGVLQRMGKQIGNESLYKQYAFTGEIFNGNQALELGLVSKVFDDFESMEKYAISLANAICSKSPLAIHGIKKMINYSRDHSIRENLEYIQMINSSFLQSNDIPLAIVSTIQKKKALFPKF